MPRLPSFSLLSSFLSALALLAPLALASPPAAAQVGLQRQSWTIPRTGGGTDTVPGMVWYPTAAASVAQRFGPFAVNVAPGAEPTPGRYPLVLLSHGTGGHELGESWLAERLAAGGYVVVALRHPGLNVEDRSLIGRAGFLTEPPRHVSRVLDQVLADPRWAARIDATRIAAIGTSIGGHTVLALAGGRPDPARGQAWCSTGGQGLAEDTAMCAQAGYSVDRPAPPLAVPQDPPEVRDARIRAVVADAPLGQALTPASLRAIAIPVLVQYGARDEVLAPRLHGAMLCATVPHTTCAPDAEAGHYAMFQAGTGPLGAPGHDPAEDPAGFDRRAWQARAGTRIQEFLAANLR